MGHMYRDCHVRFTQYLTDDSGELVGIKGTGGYAVKGVSCGSGVECRLDVEW